MNLTIDIGNSQTKIGVFKKDTLVKVLTIKKFNFHPAFGGTNFQISKAILSSVINHSKDLESYFQKNLPLISLTDKTALPIKNLYKTPKTLGKDRVAAVVGANHLFPKKNILVIDAGTCITYDFINKKREYLGGSISPGINMRFKTLNTFTDKLPLIKRQTTNDKRQTNFIGRSTKESILSGVEFGTVKEMAGMIEMYKKKFPSLKIVITGGDAAFFERRLKNEIFAVPNLVLIGLNTILEYNSR